MTDRCRRCAPQETEDQRSRLLGTQLFSGFGGRISQPSRQCCGEKRLKASDVHNHKTPEEPRASPWGPRYIYPLVTSPTPTLPKLDERMWVLMESFPHWTWPSTSKLRDFTKLSP